MFEIVVTPQFDRWIETLKDQRGRAKIIKRIGRMRSGAFGDVKPIGDELSEMRIEFGPGYRVYYMRRGRSVIVLLCGGDRDTQARDIKAARAIARTWES